MKRIPSARIVPLGTVGAAAVVYAWWATGTTPFTARSYAAVGIPVAIVAAVSLTPWPTARAAAPPPDDGPHQSGALHRSLPWLVIAAVGAGLEGAALALGGRFAAIPTLSTVVDHALGHHVARCALFLAWLVVGSAPALRSRLRDHRRRDLTCS